jgi:DNA-binding response OmpR family regulator
MFAAAAEQAGWETVVCDSVDSGWHVCERERYEMAIVDLDSLDASKDGMRELTAQIATHPNLLLMICGNEGDALEEIWARQLGAWLYLPGVSQRCDVEMLCRQALPVAERLAGVTPPRRLVG